MAAPVIASKSFIGDIAVETVTITAPSGISDGDLLLIAIGLDNDATAFVPPTGFTEITPNDGDKAPSNQTTFWAAYKVASSESGDYVVSWTTARRPLAMMYRITGQVSGDEIQAIGSVNTGTSTTSTALSFNTDTDDSLALAFHTIDLQATQGESGSGWTIEDAKNHGGSTPVAFIVSRKTIGTKGATSDSVNGPTLSQQWVTRQIAIRSIATFTVVTETHDTDSVLKALDQEITHTTDSFLAIAVTVVTEDHTTDSILKALDNEISHTTDSVLGERDPGISVTHDTDSVLKTIGLTVSHSTDSQVNTVITITHTTDSLVVTGVTVTHDTDSALRKIDNELIHTTDSIVYVTQTETHDTDSLLKAINTLETHDTDSVLRALDKLVTHTTDSALREIDNEISHDTDSLLLAIKSLTHTTDSHIVLPTIQIRIHTTDSILKKLDNIVSHTTDSLLTNIRGKRVIVDLCVDETSTEDLCVDDESKVDLCA